MLWSRGVSNRTILISSRDFYAQLQSTESRLETRKYELGEIHSANTVYKPSTSKSSYRPDINRKPAPFPGNDRGGMNERGIGNSNYTERDRSDQAGRGRGNGNRHVCQLCSKVGHLASQCFKRFKREFLGIGNDRRYTEKQVAAATHGHTPSYPVDPSWYADTVATDHLSNQLEKLTTRDS
jgi:hypothetical protein